MRTFGELAETLKADKDDKLFMALLTDMQRVDPTVPQYVKHLAVANIDTVAAPLATGKVTEAIEQLHAIAATCVVLGWMLAKEEEKSDA